jgi:uncharacterized repeat protein (TIGR03803 family)
MRIKSPDRHRKYKGIPLNAARLRRSIANPSYRIETLENRILLSSYATLASFSSSTGTNPEGALAEDSSGDIFGATYAGGSSSDGTIFELANGATAPTTLATFSGTNGQNPEGGVIMDGSGNLFGTTFNGGANGFGEVFELAHGATSVTVLASFAATITGKNPIGSLIMDSNGDLFGTTKTSGSGSDGTVWELVDGATSITTIAAFTGTNGKNPYGGLVRDSNGDLFGTTNVGGTSNLGSIYEIASGTSTITVLHSFTGTGTDGSDAEANLVMDSNGDLFGTTNIGGSSSDGVVFEYNTGTSTYTTLVSLTSATGKHPLAGLVEDANGNLFGFTEQSSASGTVFELPSGTTTITVLHSFGGSGDGTAPENGNLLMDSQGDLFGVAYSGGANGDGSIYEVTPGTVLSFTQQPSNVTAGVADNPSIQVTVKNGWGDVLTTNTSNVTLSIASGPGSIGGTDTVSAVAGVATFNNVTLNTAGSYTLTAADGSATTATSSSFTVSAAAASQLAFSTQPSNVTAGVANSPSIVVDVEDQYGNLVTTDTSNVTLGVNSGPGAASGTLTVAASGGVATFANFKIDLVGAYTLTASDGSLGTATSNSFDVTGAGASQVAFDEQPSNVAAGSSISPSVTVVVEDQFGNVVTTDSSNVTIAINTGSGTLNGTLTVAASSGIATFGNLSIDTSGNYTFVASDGILSSAISNSFTVSAASASQVVYATQPSNATAGVADSPSIVLDVEDQYGNLCATDSSNVTLSVATGPGSAGGTLTVAASGGVATFDDVVLDTAGSYTLTARDGDLTSATSNSFSVSAAGAAELAIVTQPSDVTAGADDSPFIVVDVEDQFGNLVTTDSSNVSVAVATGPGGANGTLTEGASGGAATFSDVNFDTAGSYTLTASDGSLTTATSSSFTVGAASAAQLAFIQQPTDVAAGSTISPSVTVAVEDQYGNVVTTDSSSVALNVATGPQSGGGTRFASDGIATFSTIVLDTAGSYTLIASDGSLITATSNSFTVSAAAASQLAYVAQPSDVTAGVAISPSISLDVEDQYGNLVTTDSSNVTLSVDTGPGVASGTLTVAASDGIVTFSNVKLDTAGSHTLLASDGSLTTAISNSFTVSAAASAELAFSTQPSNVTAGVANSPSITVDVEDQFGNLVTTDSSDVTIAVNTGPGSASGTLSVAASSGVATFDNVILVTAGNYTLTATDGSLSSANSSSFTVDPASASQVVFDQQPSTASALDPISPAITVAVEDQYGNIVTTDSSSVTVGLNSGAGALGGTLTEAAVDGVATFSDVYVTAIGSHTLSASDGSLTSAISDSFMVTPAATQLAYFVQPSDVTAGAANSPSIVVDVENQYGTVVVTDSSDVTLSIASGPGAIGGTDTVAAVDGVATFDNVKLDTVGTYTLTASDGDLTTATSNSLTVSPAAASQLAYAVQPSNVAAGITDSPSIVLDVEDAYGNLITTDNSNVTLSIGSGPGSVYGTLTVAASDGVATFSTVNFRVAGSYTLTASDGSLTPATSNSFTVTPAPASHLIFATQPSNVIAGAANSPSIVLDVEDQFGNLVTSDSSNVTIAVSYGAGSASGTLTVAAGGGVATFNNVEIDKSGNYELTATDGGLLEATSNGFTVSPAAASKLVYGFQPSGVTAGVADSPSIVAVVEDQYNNIITTDSSNVTLSVATGPGSAGGTLTVAATSGVATFSNVFFDTSGNYTLTASDGSLTPTTSSTFTVVPAAAAKLAYAVQPNNVATGVAENPSIVLDVEDQYGNVVTGDSSNVTLAVASGPGSASGTLTVAASSGVATFSNVSFNTSGNYTLIATDGSLTAATSSSFAVGFALTTPAVSSSIDAGGSYTIDWTGAHAGDTVQVWAEGGPNNSWTELTTGVPEANGSYTWNTTGVDHGWYYFQAWDIPTSGTPIAADSPNYLHIVASGAAAPNISQSNPPLSGSSVVQGHNFTLDFNATDGSGDTNPIYVQLWVYSGDTGQWTELANANYLPASQGSYVWNTTGVAPGWYSFAAHATNGDQWSYTASPGWVNVTVPTPTIAFTTPTSGQSVAPGGTFNLNWNITGLSSADFANSTVQIWGQHLVDGSPVWSELTASVSASAGTYAWTVPTSPGAGTYYAFSIWLNDGDMWWAQASPNWLHVS